MAPVEDDPIAQVGWLVIELSASEISPERFADSSFIEPLLGFQDAGMETQIVADHFDGRESNWISIGPSNWLLDKGGKPLVKASYDLSVMLYRRTGNDDGLGLLKHEFLTLAWYAGIVAEYVVAKIDEILEVSLANTAQPEDADLHRNRPYSTRSE